MGSRWSSSGKILQDSIHCRYSLRFKKMMAESKHEPEIPFGSLVKYYPNSAKDQSRIHQFGKIVLPGLFLGYALYTG